MTAAGGGGDDDDFSFRIYVQHCVPNFHAFFFGVRH